MSKHSEMISAYNKTRKVIDSCESLNQLVVASNMVDRFIRMYSTSVLQSSAVITSREVIELHKSLVSSLQLKQTRLQ